MHGLGNVVIEIQLKLLNERALGTGEYCLCVIFLVNYSNGTSQNRMWELSMNIFTLWSLISVWSDTNMRSRLVPTRQHLVISDDENVPT